MVDLIEKKRDGGAHSRDELEALVGGYVRGEVPDYQVAAWLMAVCWRGMLPDEVATLTRVMAASGAQLDLSPIGRPVADKHSTGGVGDKTSLVVMPLVAACGVPVGKMSGRGLGFTGGTIDKLECFAGIRLDLDAPAFVRQLGEVGLVITGQSADLAPADGKLYALRDVTGTVPSLPLIASSIMSKKLAAGAHVIVLDVKTGSGAFMRERESARALARAMVEIGAAAGRRMAAVVSDMSQPLGRAVGNALEIAEALDTLEGQGPPELTDFALELAGTIVELASAEARTVGGREARSAVGAAPHPGPGAASGTLDAAGAAPDPTPGAAYDAAEAGSAHERVRQALRSGAGLRAFRRMVETQGGDPAAFDDRSRLPAARLRRPLLAEADGYLARLDALTVARAGILLGGGRERKGEPIDLSVGIVLQAKVGDEVRHGAPIAVLHANDEHRLRAAERLLRDVLEIAPTPVEPTPLILERLPTPAAPPPARASAPGAPA
jgi:pyrimidine-nucleoside phosphorylase